MGNGTYSIGSEIPPWRLRVPDSFADGASVESVFLDDTDNRKWILKSIGSGYYNIISQHNGLYLDDRAGTLKLYNSNGTTSQWWRLEPLPLSERILKIFPSIDEPEDRDILIEITYGQTLAETSDKTLTYWGLLYYSYEQEENVKLPGRYVWLDPTIKPTVADSDKTNYKMKFAPYDMDTFGEVDYTTEKFVHTRTITVLPAEAPDGMPSSEMNPAHNVQKIGDIELSENWKWNEADANTALEDGTPVTATAVYTGADGGAGNYKKESVTVTITRSSCSHPESKLEIRGKTEPDCTNDGYTGDTYCSECDTIIETGSTVRASGHKYGNWKMKTAPTCTEDGVLEAKCSVCGDVSVQSIDALGHNISKTEAAEATCENSGNIEYWSCENCGKLFSSESGTNETALGDVIIPAAGHKEDGGTTDPETGKKIFRCTVCKAVIREENSFIFGDVNHDGRINNTDIILLGRAYMAGDGNKYLSVADMNNDGRITNADIILLGRLYMTGKSAG